MRGFADHNGGKSVEIRLGQFAEKANFRFRHMFRPVYERFRLLLVLRFQ